MGTIKSIQLLTQKDKSKLTASAVALAGAMLVTACGGGGDGDAGGTSYAPFDGLSTAQQNYESLALASNGGQHFVQAYLAFSISNTGIPSLNPGSYFSTVDSSLAQSPSTGPQLLTVGRTSLDPALAVPAASVQRYLVNGAVVTGDSSSQDRITYVGANVQTTHFASDRQTPVLTLLGTDYTVVPLSGAIASSPSELFEGSVIGFITNKINGVSLYNSQATWQSGSAYMKVTRQVVGDTVETGDCAAPKTSGTNVTPCSTTASTLEAFFPYTSTADKKTYNLSDGQIVTLAGSRSWVANVPLDTATTSYRVFYQNNGQIDVGTLIRSGTTLAIQSSSSATPQNFYIFLSSAAAQSVKSAITF